MNQKNKAKIRKITVTAMLAAVAFVLQFMEFPIPIMPGFIKFDFSDLPALIGAFALGPVSGAAIEIVKNILHLPLSSSGGVGELSNALLGIAFVLPAGIIYTRHKTMRGGILGAVFGAFLMAVISLVTNYYIVYPVYIKLFFGGNEQGVISVYQALNGRVKTLWQALLWFNVPFTFVKGMVSVAISAIIYKPLSPIIKGTRTETGAQRGESKNR